MSRKQDGPRDYRIRWRRPTGEVFEAEGTYAGEARSGQTFEEHLRLHIRCGEQSGLTYLGLVGDESAEATRETHYRVGRPWRREPQVGEDRTKTLCLRRVPPEEVVEDGATCPHCRGALAEYGERSALQEAYPPRGGA